MNGFSHVRTSVLAILAVLAVLECARFAASQISITPPVQTTWAPTATALLAQPIADSTPNAAQLRRGQYLVAGGDCMPCHIRDGGEPFAGGLGLKTPFGLIYSANITSDRETGIGNWTSDQFYHAMHNGTDDEGKNLYAAS